MDDGYTDNEADCVNVIFYFPPFPAAIGRALGEGGTKEEKATVAAPLHMITNTLADKARQGKVRWAVCM